MVGCDCVHLKALQRQTIISRCVCFSAANTSYNNRIYLFQFSGSSRGHCMCDCLPHPSTVVSWLLSWQPLAMVLKNPLDQAPQVSRISQMQASDKNREVFTSLPQTKGYKTCRGQGGEGAESSPPVGLLLFELYWLLRGGF